MIRFTFDKWTSVRAVFEHFQRPAWNESLPCTAIAGRQSFLWYE